MAKQKCKCGGEKEAIRLTYTGSMVLCKCDGCGRHFYSRSEWAFQEIEFAENYQKQVYEQTYISNYHEINNQ